MSPVVVLVGAPGAGKTSIGRALAAALNLDFADTDELIESSEDRSVADIFIDDGEDYFRAREREAVAQAMATEMGVVALGGGAILAKIPVRGSLERRPCGCDSHQTPQ